MSKALCGAVPKPGGMRRRPTGRVQCAVAIESEFDQLADLERPEMGMTCHSYPSQPCFPPLPGSSCSIKKQLAGVEF